MSPGRQQGRKRGGGKAAPLRFRRRDRSAGILAMLPAVLVFLGTGEPAHAGASSLEVSATVLSKSVCRFATRASVLDFGALDPAVQADATATVSIPFVCRGSAPIAVFAVSGDDGAHPDGSGNRRMRHASAAPAEFLPYSLALSPFSGAVPRNVVRTLTGTGTVPWSGYGGARMGNYSDAVVLSILP